MRIFVIFGLIFLFAFDVYGQINNSPVIGKNSIPANPKDLDKETENKKLKDKRETSKGEDIGGSTGSQSSGSAIGATQLGQKDLLNGPNRKKRDTPESKLPSAMQTDVEKETKKEKRQSKLLEDILIPYRKRSPKVDHSTKDHKLTQGAMVPMGIPVRFTRDIHGSLIEAPLNEENVDKNTNVRFERDTNETNKTATSKGTSAYFEVGLRPDEIGKPHSSIKADDVESSPKIGTA